MARRIRSTAPARMDLAGGTLDIYPLYLFEEYGLTVNAAINYGSEVIVEERDDRRVVLRALDIDASAEAECISDVCLDGDLSLLARVTR
ncbi:MAG TPA: GHMP kinase, partial [Armatimonadota bacterium]|nr:GHMP kinase [Armatimonadota bacterium]